MSTDLTDQPVGIFGVLSRAGCSTTIWQWRRVVGCREVQRESQGQLGASVAGGQVCTGAWVSLR